MTDPMSVTPEFSRPLAADSIGVDGQQRRIEADEGEREALARRFDLLALDRLEASLELRRVKGDLVRMKGHLLADVVQSCVVTLAPVPARLEVEFETSYSATAQAPEADIDPLGEDAPEAIERGEIDLGEAVAQQLAVALEPYPRAPGATLDPDSAAAGDAGRRSPFVDLARLKRDC